MYCCVYISLTKYVLERVQLLFRISYLSQVTDATFFSFIPVVSQCIKQWKLSVQRLQWGSIEWVVPLQRN